MGFRYDNQGYGSSYLIYEVENNDKVDTVILDMLQNRSIEGLLSAKCTQMNEKVYIMYDISLSRMSVSGFVSNRVTSASILNMLMGIINAVESVDEYMLDLNCFIFDMDYIFVDRSGNSKMVCLPIISESKQINFVDFFKNIIICLKFDTNERYNPIGEILNYLNSAQEFSISEFGELIMKLKANIGNPVTYGVTKQKKIENQAPQEPAVQQPKSEKQDMNPQTIRKTASGSFEIPNVPDNPQNNVSQLTMVSDDKPMSFLHLLLHFSKENLAVYRSQHTNKNNVSNQLEQTDDDLPFAIPNHQTNQPVNLPQNKPISQPASHSYPKTDAPYDEHKDENFGETTDFAEENDDSTLECDDEATKENNGKRAILRRVLNGEIVEITKSVFHVGRKKRYSDYAIYDNRRISREHADIVERNGEYFIVDTYSKGHTYINGSDAVVPGQEFKLKSGDRIRLANEEFEFKVDG